jgi:hypothetical protein
MRKAAALPSTNKHTLNSALITTTTSNAAHHRQQHRCRLLPVCPPIPPPSLLRYTRQPMPNNRIVPAQQQAACARCNLLTQATANPSAQCVWMHDLETPSQEQVNAWWSTHKSATAGGMLPSWGSPC